MKRLAWLVTTLTLVGGLSACAPNSAQLNSASPPKATPAASVSAATPSSVAATPSAVATGASSTQEEAIAIGDFGFADINQLGAAGCGMTLWKPEEAAKPGGDRRFIFLNGLEPNSTLMKLNGEVVRFRRTAASGSEFYGQQTSQTFVSQDGQTTVQVNVTLGQEGEIESVTIQNGTLRVDQGSASVELPVRGDAGC